MDEIVAELEKVPEVARCYAVWNDLRDQMEGYYKTMPRQHAPLSQQKGFCAIKNRIVRAAERLQPFTATDGQSAAERTQVQDDHGMPERQSAYHIPEVLPPAARLLYHMGRIFRDNALPLSNPMGIRVDSKRRRKLMEMKGYRAMRPDKRGKAIIEILCQRRHETMKNLASEFGVSIRTTSTTDPECGYIHHGSKRGAGYPSWKQP